MKEKEVIVPQKPKDYFNTEHLEKTLKQRSVSGGAVTIIAQAAKFILQTGSTILLARFLTPNDYGLVGMTTVFMNFVQLFKDLGLSAATIQRKEINQQQVSTLFWINLFFGIILCLLVSFLAPLIADFYEEPRLISITIAFASVFLFSALTVQHQALLKRQMYFMSLVVIEVISLTLGLIGGIIIAWLGFSYWALVLMPIVKAAINMLAVWIACDWRPSFPKWSKEVNSMLAFGRNLTSFNVINYFSRNLDNILLGRFWGAAQLGLYAQAYRLVLLPILQINVPIDSVVLPVLSRLQHEPIKYARYYYQSILAVTFLGMPIVVFLFATTDKLIPVILGEQWLGIVPIFRLLMPAAFLGTFNIAGGWVYQSLDRTDRQLKIGLISSTVDIIIFLISINWGAIGVAAGYGLSRPFIWLPAFIYCYHNTPLTISKLWQTLSYPTTASFGAGLVVIGYNNLFPLWFKPKATVVIDGIVYGFIYLTIWLILPGGKKTISLIKQTILSLKK